MSLFKKQEMLLECDQSNVLLACIIFFCILLSALLFFSACIKSHGVYLRPVWYYTNSDWRRDRYWKLSPWSS